MSDRNDSRENSPEGSQSRPPMFELAISREEIYADARGKAASAQVSPVLPPELPPPPDAPETAPSEAAVAAPAPAFAPLVARRRKTTMERLREHPVLWPSAGALVALAAGFFVALWLSSSSLESDVRPLVTSRAILKQSTPASQDREKITELEKRIAKERSTIAWKTGGVWMLVSAGIFYGWLRVFREP